MGAFVFQTINQRLEKDFLMVSLHDSDLNRQWKLPLSLLSQRRVFAVVTSHQESQLQRLLLVESRVAVSGVVQAEILLCQAFTSTCTFRYRIASQFKMHTTKERALLLVDLQR